MEPFAGALMTGSGSAVFGIFDHPKTRDDAYAKLKGTGACEWFSCETVNQWEEF